MLPVGGVQAANTLLLPAATLRFCGVPGLAETVGVGEGVSDGLGLGVVVGDKLGLGVVVRVLVGMITGGEVEVDETGLAKNLLL